MTNYAVEIKNVYKRFPLPTGGELEACKDINITLEKGQSLGIVGESGSGKTTLVRMIMKMLPITEGEIYVDGVEIQHMNSEQTKEYRKKIQMVFQDPSAAFNPRMKVKDIILEPLYNFGLLEKGKEEQIAGDYLEMVDLPREFMHRYPHEMSGGQRQRVAIARAIVLDPHSTRSVRDGQNKSVPFIIPPSFFRNTSSILLSTSRTASASLPSQNALPGTVQDSPHSSVLHRRTAHW